MKIIAHRGIHKDYPENTLEAFKAALDNGCHGIETDVRTTIDGTPVLFHDYLINGKPISTFTRKQLSKEVGYEVPKLKHLLKILPKNFFLNLELKSRDVFVSTKELMEDYPNVDYLVTSFWHNMTNHFFCKKGVLVSHRPYNKVSLEAMIPKGVTYIVWDYERFDVDFVEELTQYKHLVFDIGESEELPDNLEGIITDYSEFYLKGNNDQNS